jgi:hypothetical protein
MARFWAQVLGWRILSEREREVVTGTDATAPVGICFMPVTHATTTKNRLTTPRALSRWTVSWSGRIC